MRQTASTKTRTNYCRYQSPSLILSQAQASLYIRPALRSRVSYLEFGFCDWLFAPWPGNLEIACRSLVNSVGVLLPSVDPFLSPAISHLKGPAATLQQKLRHFSPTTLVTKCAASLVPGIFELHAFFKPLGSKCYTLPSHFD